VSLEDFKDLDLIIDKAVLTSLREVYAGIALSENEREVQQSASDQIKDKNLKAPTDESDDVDEQEEDGEEGSVKKVTKVTPKEEDRVEIEVPTELPETLDVKDLAKTINIIRSGGSLKDEDVFGRFSSYFGALTPAEKIALKGFLDGLAQVIAGDIPGAEARNPTRPPYNVDMSAKPEQRAGQSDDTTTIADTAAEKQTPSGTMTPIVVGEVADRKEILNYLKEIKNDI
jgi:hypothetical protein